MYHSLVCDHKNATSPTHAFALLYASTTNTTSERLLPQSSDELPGNWFWFLVIIGCKTVEDKFTVEMFLLNLGNYLVDIEI